MQLLSEARRFGIVHVYQVEASDGAREVVRVQLAATSRYVAQERDVDIACTIGIIVLRKAFPDYVVDVVASTQLL